MRAQEPRKPVWPVMVLAHDEERHIAACLDSILVSEPTSEFEIFVMANGCTDRTEAIVAEYSRRLPHIKLISIAIGDKCNAWNVFVHETVPALAPARKIYFFMDGDARAVPGAFTTMARALEAAPHANAAAAVPVSGRNAERDRRQILAEHGLVANLYALRGAFVRRLQLESVRLPLRLEGDDGLIGALIKWDLDPLRNTFDHERIVVCPEAAFEFGLISLRRLSDWRLYWRRAIRYGRRRYEFQLLGAQLKSKGLAGLPRDISELYVHGGTLSLRWDGLYTLATWIALNEIRKTGRERERRGDG